MSMTSKEAIRLLQQNGYETISQNGSHVKLRNQATGDRIIISYHYKDLKKGFQQQILKQAGLK